MRVSSFRRHYRYRLFGGSFGYVVRCLAADLRYFGLRNVYGGPMVLLEAETDNPRLARFPGAIERRPASAVIGAYACQWCVFLHPMCYKQRHHVTIFLSIAPALRVAREWPTV